MKILNKPLVLICLQILFCINSVILDKVSNDAKLIESQTEHKASAAERISNFDFPPSSSSSSSNFRNYNNDQSQPEFDVGNGASFPQVRRFPQYPQPNPFQPNGEQSSPFQRQPHISVSSGNGSPHHSVSWNPPPTISPPSNSRTFVPPQAVPQPPPTHEATHRYNLNSNYQPDERVRFQPPPQPIEQPARLPQPFSNNQLPRNLDNSPPATPSLPSLSTSSSSSQVSPSSNTKPDANTTKPGKKDDVVIYYYYYYDDDKNGTKPKTSDPNSPDTNLDVIPSLESYDTDSEKNKSGNNNKLISSENSNNSVNYKIQNTIKKNDLHAINIDNHRLVHDKKEELPKDSQPESGLVNKHSLNNNNNNINNNNAPETTSATTLDNQNLNLNSFQNRPNNHRSQVVNTPEPPVRSSTSVSVSVSGDGIQNGNPVSNIFRYGSNSGFRPNFDAPPRSAQFGGPGPRTNSFSPDFPGQGFRHIPAQPTPPSNFRYQDFSGTRNQDFPRNTFTFEHPNSVRDFLKPQQVQPQAPPTTSTTTTSTTTTTTTTEAPKTTTEEVTEAPKRGPGFGRRRPGQGRSNPLQRQPRPRPQVSTTSTTTTTTQRPTTRPRPRNSFRKQNRFNSRRNQEENNNNNEPSSSTTSTTPSSSPVESSTQRRFGSGRNRGPSRSRVSNTTPTSSQPSPSSTTSTTERPALRRPTPSINRFTNTRRNRLPFLKGRKPEVTSEEPPKEPENTENKESNDGNENSTNKNNSSEAIEKDKPKSEAEDKNNANEKDESSEDTSPEPPSSTTTERNRFGRNRLRNPLLPGSRPRPNFGNRRPSPSNN